MTVMVLTMRALHVVLGAFWVGAMIFNAVFLMPALRDAGPDGAKVMTALLRRRFAVVMPIVALVTILAGLWLYWHVSGGFQPAFMRSGMGMTIGVGAAAALAAFIVGITLVRPLMLKAVALGQDPSQQAAAQAVRQRAGAANRAVAVLVAIAAVAMAMARYL